MCFYKFQHSEYLYHLFNSSVLTLELQSKVLNISTPNMMNEGVIPILRTFSLSFSIAVMYFSHVFLMFSVRHIPVVHVLIKSRLGKRFSFTINVRHKIIQSTCASQLNLTLYNRKIYNAIYVISHILHTFK